MSATHRENEVGAGGQKKMVPLARLERALPKKTDFESVASTNSATGAQKSEPVDDSVAPKGQSVIDVL